MEYLPANAPLDINWRSIVLFGKNVATYKFALAQSLIELSQKGKTVVTLEDLAIPFSDNIIQHLKTTNKQGTSPRSQFLDVCREFIKGNVSQDILINSTVRLGFNNVIDACHIVNRGPIQTRFFIDNRNQNNSIILTDDLFALRESFHFSSLPLETEARWRLVETAWSLSMPIQSLIVNFDPIEKTLFIEERRIRQNVTTAKWALNGYQKGKCFYCFSDISIDLNEINLGDVDHFFPNTLKKVIPPQQINLDGIWNLVLSCKECNRGAKGKFAQIPNLKYLERLYNRNNFLINSHHPLRETLINQLGATDEIRIDRVKQIDEIAIQYLHHRWSSEHEYAANF